MSEKYQRQIRYLESERDELRRDLAEARSRLEVLCRRGNESAVHSNDLPHTPSDSLSAPTDEQWHEAVCEYQGPMETSRGAYSRNQEQVHGAAIAHEIDAKQRDLLWCRHFSDNLGALSESFGMPPLMLLPIAATFYFCGVLIGRRESSAAEVERVVRGLVSGANE